MEQFVFTKKALSGGFFRYERDGEVITAKSKRPYTYASAYKREKLGPGEEKLGRKVGEIICFLHSREELAIKGSPDGNAIAEGGDWSRIPGAFKIEEVA